MNKGTIINDIEKSQLKSDYPNFKAGDVVQVHLKVIEGNKERTQIYQGVVLGRQGSGISASFNVQKISSGVKVERIFPLHSPNIVKIKVVSKGKVRRSKLYYLRDVQGKAARIKELK